MPTPVAQSALVMRPAPCHRVGRSIVLFISPSCSSCGRTRASGIPWITTEGYRPAQSVTNPCGHAESYIRLMRESVVNLRFVATAGSNPLVSALAEEYVTTTKEAMDHLSRVAREERLARHLRKVVTS